MLTKALQILTQLVVNAKDADLPAVEAALRRANKYDPSGAGVAPSIIALLKGSRSREGEGAEVGVATEALPAPFHRPFHR